MAVSGPSSFVQFFIASQLIGAILLSVVVSTVLLSRHIHRNVTWINLCITWIISALSYSLLTFAGQQSGPEPSPELCMTQSVLLYGAPLVTTMSAFTLIVQLYYDLSSALSGIKRVDPKRDFALCAGPYVIYIAIMIAAIIYGRNQTVERAVLGTYCHYTSGSFGNFVAVAVVVILMTNFSILAYLITRLYRLYGSSGGDKTRSNLRPVIKGITRIAILKVAVLFPIIVSMIFIGDESHRNLFDAMIATMPIITFLVFGLQTDILQAWCFWRRPGDNIPEEVHVPTELAQGAEKV